MLLMPKKTKYRKQQRGRMKGKAMSCNKIDFGEYGLYSMECGYITNRQIESVRVVMARAMRRSGKIYFRIFPDIPYTKKPAETRMGKGKGNPEGWVCKVKPGRVLFEVAGVSREIAMDSLMSASSKLPIRVKIMERMEGL